VGTAGLAWRSGVADHHGGGDGARAYSGHDSAIAAELAVAVGGGLGQGQALGGDDAEVGEADQRDGAADPADPPGGAEPLDRLRERGGRGGDGHLLTEQGQGACSGEHERQRVQA
jgi:hypothetical protein